MADTKLYRPVPTANLLEDTDGLLCPPFDSSKGAKHPISDLSGSRLLLPFSADVSFSLMTSSHSKAAKDLYNENALEKVDRPSTDLLKGEYMACLKKSFNGSGTQERYAAKKKEGCLQAALEAAKSDAEAKYAAGNVINPYTGVVLPSFPEGEFNIASLKSSPPPDRESARGH